MIAGVYGLGRFGTFWAELLAKQDGLTVLGYNRTARTVSPSGVELVEFDRLFDARVIFLCTAISSTEPVLRQLAPGLRPGTLIVDTC